MKSGIKCTLPSLTLLLAALAAPGAVAEGEPWQLVEEEDGIRVYSRPVQDSPFLEIKGTVTLHTWAERVSEIMGTGDSCAAWRANCKSSTVLEEISEHERLVYLVLDLPWPLSDRDLVVHSTTVVDEPSSTATVYLDPASSRHPTQDYIRAESRGTFVIKALGPQQVEFTYTMHTDLGGDLPAGTVNSRLPDTALDELTRLRKLAEG